MSRTAIVDSGASFHACNNENIMVNKRPSKRTVVGYDSSPPQRMKYDGDIHMRIHNNKKDDDVYLKIDASTVKGIRSDLLSVAKIVKGLGWTCKFKPTGWEGFTRRDPRTGTIQRIPVDYNPATGL